MLQCFSSLSRALYDLVRQTPELCLYAKTIKWSLDRSTYHPTLALGCSRYVEDHRIASLLGSSFRMVAAQLLLVNLRATAITVASVITILQTCPLLEELDVGECNKIDVLELARRLKKIPLESLVVGSMQKLEICGTGEGTSWVGYRQPIGSNHKRFSSDWYMRDSGRAHCSFRSKQDIELTERFDKLRSCTVLPAMPAIEAIVHALQRLATSFCMHVNKCENYLTFAQFLPLDGRNYMYYDVKRMADIRAWCAMRPASCARLCSRQLPLLCRE